MEIHMPNTAAIQAIENYVRKCGRDYRQWCTGTAADGLQRMLAEHGVAEEGDGCGWITYQCATAAEAREVRDYFVAGGMKGAADRDGAAAATVYVFRITADTRL
jgi:hypothetical protein